MSVAVTALIVIGIVLVILAGLAASALTAIAYHLGRVADALEVDLAVPVEPPSSATGVPLPVEHVRGRDWSAE